MKARLPRRDKKDNWTMKRSYLTQIAADDPDAFEAAERETQRESDEILSREILRFLRETS